MTLGQGKVYVGKFSPNHNYQVFINGERLRNLSYPSADAECSGFSWGYGGGGPNALAHSLLFDFFDGSDEIDSEWQWVGGQKPPWIHFWTPFLDWFIRTTPRESEWVLTGEEIAEWIGTLPEYDFAAWEAYIQHYPPSNSR
jgi:hypothetical protein